MSTRRTNGPTLRKDGLWVQLVTVRPGKRKALYGKTRQEVVTKATILRGAVASGLYTEQSRLTLGDWLLQWLDTYKRPHIEPQSTKRYETIIRRHLLPTLGTIRLTALKPIMIQDAYNQLKIKPQTLSAIHNVLRQALEQAVENEYLSRNPAQYVRRAPITDHFARTLTLDDVQRFVVSNRGQPFFAAALLGFFAGLRRGEILGLQWHDIDWQERSVCVRRAIGNPSGPLAIMRLKTAAAHRAVPLPTVLLEALQAQRQVLATVAQRAGRTLKPHDFVCAHPTGKPYSPSRLSRAFRSMLERASLPRIRLHDTRHTYATILLDLGEPLEVISPLLGHSRRTMTTLYARATLRRQRQSIERLDEALQGGKVL